MKRLAIPTRTLFGVIFVILCAANTPGSVLGQGKPLSPEMQRFVDALARKFKKEYCNTPPCVMKPEVKVFDLNNDGLPDFAFHMPPKSCGSAGCLYELYLGVAKGKWRPIGDLFGRWLHPTETKNKGFKDIRFAGYSTMDAKDIINDPERIYEVYRWNGRAYKFRGYIHVGIFSRPVRSNLMVTKGEVDVHRRPDDRSKAFEFDHERMHGDVYAKVRGKPWYLVKLSKWYAGYIHAKHIRPRSN